VTGGTRRPRLAFCGTTVPEDHAMKGILAWLIGIPIPIIILLYLFGAF
jgi:hypothetical protein